MQYSPAELERRIERVRALLDSHDDIYDALSRQESSSASPGFAEPRLVRLKCGNCAGAGCGQCERSAAWAASEHELELRPGLVLVELRDPYDTGREGSFDPNARTKREDADRVDKLIDRLRQDELIREGLIAHVDFERELKRADDRDRRGSYRELRLALDRMPARLRGDEALEWIALRMPKKIRIPRWAYEQELERLRLEVITLREHGWQVSEIARDLSISQRQVKNLLKAKPA